MDGTSKKIIIVIILAVVTVGIGVLIANRNTERNMETVLPETITESESMEYTTATVTTNMGSFTITLDRAHAPNTVENFTKLAADGFYNGTKFHRIIAGFMIQGGDPLSKDDSMVDRWGTGGPGYKFADEISATNSNKVGSIAMANSGPNTNGSQFFINVADNSHLNTGHTVFGQVTSGYDVVEKISKVAIGSQDRPVDPVVITKIELK